MCRYRKSRAVRPLPQGAGWWVNYIPSNAAVVLLLEANAERLEAIGKSGAAIGSLRAAETVRQQAESVAERLILLGPGSIAQLPQIAEGIGLKISKYVFETVAALLAARAQQRY